MTWTHLALDGIKGDDAGCFWGCCRRQRSNERGRRGTASFGWRWRCRWRCRDGRLQGSRLPVAQALALRRGRGTQHRHFFGAPTEVSGRCHEGGPFSLWDGAAARPRGRSALRLNRRQIVERRRRRAAVGAQTGARPRGQIEDLPVAGEAVQSESKGSSVEPALAFDLGHSLAQHGLKALRQNSPRALDRRCVFRKHLDQGVAHAGASKRRTTQQQVPKHNRSRIQVAAGVERFAAGLLGRHVFWGAENRAGNRQRLLVRDVVGRDFGDPKVDDLDGVWSARLLRHHDVLRLDIAVKHPPRMGAVQGPQQLHPDAGNSGRPHGPA